MNSTHNWGGDFALYIHQAQGILNGNIEEVAAINGYALQHSSYETFSPELYPWGWPLLLVPVVAIVGINYLWMKVYMLGFFLGASFLTYRIVARETSKSKGLLVAGCVAFNAPLLLYTDNVLSEFPFLFFVLLSLCTYRNFRRSRQIGKLRVKGVMGALVTGFVLFFTTIIRSEGFLLLGAILLHECFEFLESKHKRAFLHRYRMPGMLWLFFVVFSVLYQIVLPQGSGAHLEHLKLFQASTVQNNINFYGFKFSSFFGPYLNGSFIWVLLVVSYVGLVRRWRNNREMVLFVVFLQALLLVWPHQSTRYLFVQLPFIFYFLMEGLEVIGFAISIKHHRLSLAGMFMVFLLSGLVVDTARVVPDRFMEDSIAEGPETPDAREMFSFIRQETAAGSSIVFFKPRVMSLYTGRKSFLVDDGPESARKEGDYLVIHKFMGNYNQLGNIDSRPPKWLQPCFSNGSFIIYKTIKNL